MTQEIEDTENLMPTERKSFWRTPEERRMSDLTRVLEWLERRQGKKRALQVCLVEECTGRRITSLLLSKSFLRPVSKKDIISSRKGSETDTKGKRLSLISTSYGRDMKKSDIDIKDVIALETNSRVSSFRRQSTIDPAFQDSMFGSRRAGLLREWSSKAPDNNYERKLKSLMEKGLEPKMESAKMLKPEEVLSCRYLRLSKNNIKTLIKLCKDAGMDVDIHPHMVEAEIDAKKIFGHRLSVAL
uniref:Similar to human chromosome 16 open reading frame 78 n=1 Tax=Rattus norvegicus TaxID=10116 RepID=D3ZYH9_RAT